MSTSQENKRPDFSLMGQADVQNAHHMQVPRWLFYDARYEDISLDAKWVYVFLLNRFQLSRRNKWVNEYGEVFVIFPRKELSAELHICEKRISAAFKALVDRNLIWEKRTGRGAANRIYLARITPLENSSYTCAPFVDEVDDGSTTADMEVLDDAGGSEVMEEPSNPPLQNSQNSGSTTANMTVPEPPKVPPSYKDFSYIDSSYTDVSQSVPPTPRQRRRPQPTSDGQTDEDREFEEILEGCELFIFPPEEAAVYENAIERLFYSRNFTIGNATLPQNRVRSRLQLLNGIIMQNVAHKLAANKHQDVRNSTAYTMSTIFNAICESESDCMVDPYLNSLRA